MILAGPNAGLFNVLYRAVTGAEGALVNIFSMPGLIYVTSLYTFPVVFILTSAALSVTPADLEEAARIAGAGRLAVMRTITLPLALPAIVGGFILAFLEALVLFGAPAMLAIPARFHVMTTQIWAFFHYPRRWRWPRPTPCRSSWWRSSSWWRQRRLMGRRGYATVGGRATAARPVALGPWRWAALGPAGRAAAVDRAALLRAPPRGARQGLGLGWSWQNLTLRNFRYVMFEFDPTRSAIVNTLELAVVTATIAALLMGAIAYVAQRRLIRGRGRWRSSPWRPSRSRGSCSRSGSSRPTRGRRSCSTARSGSSSSPT